VTHTSCGVSAATPDAAAISVLVLPYPAGKRPFSRNIKQSAVIVLHLAAFFSPKVDGVGPPRYGATYGRGGLSDATEHFKRWNSPKIVVKIVVKHSLVLSN
jgi:hypothetical protein